MYVNVWILQDELSLRFELPGGFIKNVILSALSIAVSRDGNHPVVCQKDLLQGANLQLRGRLSMKVELQRHDYSYRQNLQYYTCTIHLVKFSMEGSSNISCN